MLQVDHRMARSPVVAPAARNHCVKGVGAARPAILRKAAAAVEEVVPPKAASPARR